MLLVLPVFTCRDVDVLGPPVPLCGLSELPSHNEWAWIPFISHFRQHAEL